MDGIDIVSYLMGKAAGGGGGGGGVTILSGTGEPSAGLGSNGQIYLLTESQEDMFGAPDDDTPDDGSISADSAYSTYYPYKAFGNQGINGWGMNGTGTGHLLFVFTTKKYKPVRLSYIDDYTPAAGVTFSCGSFEFQASNDGISWDTLYTRQGSASSLLTTVDISTESYYSQFRFVVTSSGGTWAGLTKISCVGNLYGGTGTTIGAAYVKVSGAWQNLIGANINDINLGS